MSKFLDLRNIHKTVDLLYVRVGKTVIRSYFSNVMAVLRAPAAITGNTEASEIKMNTLKQQHNSHQSSRVLPQHLLLVVTRSK